MRHLSLHGLFFIHRYLTERESSALGIAEWQNLSRYYRIYSVIVRKGGYFQLCKFKSTDSCERSAFFLRVYNVFLCLLSFWCFILEWVLLAFRRYRYEYDARYYFDHPLSHCSLVFFMWFTLNSFGQIVILLHVRKNLAVGGFRLFLNGNLISKHKIAIIITRGDRWGEQSDLCKKCPKV